MSLLLLPVAAGGRRAAFALWPLAMLRCAAPVLGLLALLGCHRNVEPYVPGEEPRHADLSKIFPAGAEQAGRSTGPFELPPVPGAGPRGADPWADAQPIRGVVTVATSSRTALRPAPYSS